MTISVKQKQVSAVLDNLKTLVMEDEVLAEELHIKLEKILNQFQNEDFFGTEGQLDPRGDFRNGQWSMSKLERKELN